MGLPVRCSSDMSSRLPRPMKPQSTARIWRKRFKGTGPCNAAEGVVQSVPSLAKKVNFVNRKVVWWLCALVLTAIVAPVRAAESATVPPVFVLRIDGAIGPASADYVHRGARARRPARAPSSSCCRSTPRAGSTPRCAASSRTSSPRRCRWPPTSPRKARARRAPAPTSSTRATSRRWRRRPTSAPRRRSRSACRRAGREPERRGPRGERRVGSRRRPRHDERQAHQRRGGLHPQPRAAARPQRRMGRAGGARGGQPVGERGARRARSSTWSPSTCRELLRKLDGRVLHARRSAPAARSSPPRSAAVVTLEPDWRTRLLAVITDPSLALILMMVGIYGLLFEFIEPGLRAARRDRRDLPAARAVRVADAAGELRRARR